MNTIVLGFKAHSNGKGSGPATLVAGPEVSGHEQSQILARAKSKNEYPSGITFLQLHVIAPRITALAAPKLEPVTKTEPKKELKK